MLLGTSTTRFWQFSSHFFIPFSLSLSPHVPLYLICQTEQFSLFQLKDRRKRELENWTWGGAVVLNIHRERGRAGCANKTPWQPSSKCAALTPGSPASGRAGLPKAEASRRRRTGAPIRTFPHSSRISPELARALASGQQPARGFPREEGEPKAGGHPDCYAHSTPRSARRWAAAVSLPGATRIPAWEAAQRRKQQAPVVSRPAARVLPASPPQGGGAPTPRSRGPAAGGRAAHRGSAAAAEDQLLEEAEKQREEPRGEGEGGDRQEAANAAECLHTSLCLPWLVKEPSGSQRGGRAGWGERRPRVRPREGRRRERRRRRFQHEEENWPGGQHEVSGGLLVPAGLAWGPPAHSGLSEETPAGLQKPLQEGPPRPLRLCQCH